MLWGGPNKEGYGIEADGIAGPVTKDHLSEQIRDIQAQLNAKRLPLFLNYGALIQKSPLEYPVLQFMDKKLTKGKRYYVYVTTGTNKFLRIYYGKVWEQLMTFDAWN